MDDSKFATFKPIINQVSQDRNEMAAYYAANNLTPDNDYLSRYLSGITPTIPAVQTAQKISPVPQVQSIRDLLNQAIAKRVAVNPPIAANVENVALDDRPKEAMNFFIRKGLKKEWAAGIAGNLYHESGFDTTVPGDHGSAYGLAQWRGARREGLNQFAKVHNTDPAAFGTQLEYIYHELQNGEKDAFAALQSTNNVRDAARAFALKFERPKVYNTERADTAELYYKNW